MTTPKSEVFSHRVTTSRRTYFLDVKQLDDESRYLSIKEVKHRGDKDSPQPRIIVAEEDLSRFRNGARLVSFALELKNDVVKVGDFVKLTTQKIQDAHGNPVSGRIIGGSMHHEPICYGFYECRTFT